MSARTLRRGNRLLISFPEASPLATFFNAPSARGEVARNLRTKRDSGVKLALLGAGVIIFVAARLWHLTAPCLWFDELFSIHAARHATRDLISFVAQDVIHPPLFYLLLKIWIAVGGESVLWLRLLPVSFAVAAIIPFLSLCRELKLTFAETTLALFLMATNNYLVKYSQVLRMYSLLMFLSLCSLWLFTKFTNADSSGASVNRRRILLTLWLVVNLLLVYTHYYGWILIAVEIAFLLLNGRWRAARALVIACGALAVLFGAWAWMVWRAGQGGALEQNLGWAARPRLSHLLAFYATLTGALDFRLSMPLAATAVGIVLFVFPALVWAWSAMSRRHDNGKPGGHEDARPNLLRWLCVFALLPVVIAFALSNFLPQSIWGVRHLVIVAAPSLMLVAVAVFRLPFHLLRNAMLAAIICWIAFTATILGVRRDGDFVWCAWDSLAREMSRATPASSESIKIYAFEELIAYHLWFALQDAERGAGEFQIAAIKGVDGLAEDPAYFLPRGFSGVAVENISAVTEDYFWIAFRDAEWNAARPPVNIFLERGYRVERVFSMKAFGGEAFLVLMRRNTSLGARTRASA